MKVSDQHQQRLFTAEAAKAMLELGVRHLSVVDKGHLVAVLSMRDVLDAETTRTI
jgi:CBS domain-containing protein